MLRVVGNGTRSGRVRLSGKAVFKAALSPLPLPPQFLAPCLDDCASIAAFSRSALKANHDPGTSSRTQWQSSESAFEEPTLEYASNSRDIDEMPHSDPRRSSKAAASAERSQPTFSQAQLDLYHIIRGRVGNASSTSPRSGAEGSAQGARSNSSAATRPLQTFRWVVWLVEHSVQPVAPQRRKLGPPKPQQRDSKGKGVQRDINNSSSSAASASYQHSAPAWGLLMKYAARRSDAEAFKVIVESFAKWWGEQRLQQMLAQTAETSQYDGQLAAKPVEVQHRAPLPEKWQTQTPRQVQNLALALLTRLRNHQVIPDPDADHLARALGAAPRSTDQSSDSPYVILANLRRRQAIPSLRQKQVISKDASASLGPAQNLYIAKKIAYLSSVNASSEVRQQLRDFMALIEEHQHGGQIDVEGLKRVLLERGLTTSETTVDRSGATLGRRRMSAMARREARRLQEVEEQRKANAEPLEPAPVAGFLGSLDDPSSLASLLVQREQLLQQTIARWSSSSSSDFWSSSAHTHTSSSNSSTPSAGPPPSWLTLAALRSLAERGDSVKLKQLVKLYLSAWSSEHSALFEGGGRSYFLPRYGSTSRTRRVRAVSEPDTEPEGASFLNLLVRSHLVGAVDAESARRAYENAHADLTELCGEGDAARLLLDGQTRCKETLPTFVGRSPSLWSTYARPELPLLVPNETTVLLFLRLLRLARAPLQEGFDLVADFERKWSPACAMDRLAHQRVSPTRSEARRSQIPSSQAPQQPAPSLSADLYPTSNAPSTTREQLPLLLFTLRTSRILLRWATDRGSSTFAARAVDLANEWRWIAREVREVQETGRRGRRWERKQRRREEQGETTSLTREKRDSGGNSGSGNVEKERDGTMRGPRRIAATKYSGLRREGREWAKWRRGLTRGRRRGLLRGPAAPASSASGVSVKGVSVKENTVAGGGGDQVGT
ncbi:hypothetical protein BCV69DRAFT_285083 [Microstroma glucosiphilum]|uniref:Uncharacterized protein n=1 Tax=Pseudomicrostroma glucosiphilum TaxID=1684307 RepID=A0A316U669_9BASI|nr:hypothetical protein BCV69DRAFT_285083 [Pseudomicrostroma glucosiphilum]PWN18455.1 hypothetical protein BCV69DRAFT_285083 [Pseudomicrostroma glucosiphilum]